MICIKMFIPERNIYQKFALFLIQILLKSSPVSGDTAGKIDLLSYDGRVLRILELKKPDSEETMLRCVLEGYTYMKTVDGEKLLGEWKFPEDTTIKASPFVFRNGAQHQEMMENIMLRRIKRYKRKQRRNFG